MKARQFALGVVALFALHVLVVGSFRLYQADAVSQDESMVLTLFIGAAQLVYALPLAIAVRKRRPMVAGVATAALVTLVINFLGLRN